MDKKFAKKIFIHNRIYFVTHEELSEGRSDEDMVKAVLEGGVRVIQLRDKVSYRKNLLKKAIYLNKIISQYQAILIINDNPELALEIGANGVHLGQDDFPIKEARKLSYRGRTGEDLIIGLSTHNQLEVKEVSNSTVVPDYINLGPVFPTQTKKNSYPPLVWIAENGKYNLTKLQDMINATDLPFTVMGGIKGEHIDLLTDLGVRQFAMVTSLSQHSHPHQHANILIKKAEEAEKSLQYRRLSSLKKLSLRKNKTKKIGKFNEKNVIR